MDRTQGENYTIVDGKRKFTDGPPGTCVEENFLNSVQEEIMGAIEGAGLTPSSSNLGQLTQALNLSNKPALFELAASIWTETVNPKNFELNGGCFGLVGPWGPFLWVAVGNADGADAYLVVSPDGAIWYEKANPKNFTLNSAAYSNTLGMYVAVGAADGVDSYIVTSTDGNAWVEQAPTVAKNIALNKVIWVGELSMFVAVGNADGADGYILTSPDGTTWTEQANPKNSALVGVAYGGGKLIAVGGADGTDAYMITSTDGATWTEVSNPENLGLEGIAYGGVSIGWVAVGIAGGTANGPYVITSIDGVTWIRRVDNIEQWGYPECHLKDIVWNGYVFLAVGLDGGAGIRIQNIISSKTGAIWARRTSIGSTAAIPYDLYGIITNGERFVVVGDDDGTDANLFFSAAVT